jgi:integrase
VFTTRYGTPLSAGSIRRGFRAAIRTAEGIDASQWTPRELRHSFVSLLSDNKMPLVQISLLVGHKSTVVTELVYRHQIRPVLQDGAEVMNRIFKAADGS